jgi:hypothetical protein
LGSCSLQLSKEPREGTTKGTALAARTCVDYSVPSIQARRDPFLLERESQHPHALPSRPWGDPMSRQRLSKPVLVAALALLLPLEQAHCAFMRFEWHAEARSGAHSSHACCGSPCSTRQGGPAGHGQAPDDCFCDKLPGATLNAPTGSMPPPLMTVLVLPNAPPLPALAANILEPFLTPRVGSPPLPADLGARGLRAPPSTA